MHTAILRNPADRNALAVSDSAPERNGAGRMPLAANGGAVSMDDTVMPVPATPLLVDACRLRALPRTPVWLMRQAGRYLPEYRDMRARHSLLEICALPELATEVSSSQCAASGLDAAIMFADILLPLVPMGVEVEFRRRRGTGDPQPHQLCARCGALRPVDIESALAPTLEALRQCAPACRPNWR